MSVGMHVKTQLAERKWENAEFPIVCEGNSAGNIIILNINAMN